jgi:anti-sigma factor RsiW
MPCSEALRLQEYFDGELDAATAAALERHLEGCAECAEMRADLDETRRLLREEAPYHRADAALRRRIAEALDAADDDTQPVVRRLPVKPNRNFLWGAVSGIGATAAAACLAFLLLLPARPDPLVVDVMNAHLRSMMSDHLIDVVSSDRHTVKPWFAGHSDISPPATDYAKEGYPLIGGRLDYVDGHRAAVVVYRHGAHVINLFVWRQDGAALPGTALRNGYHLVFWRNGDLAFCATSDTALDELQTFVDLVKATTGRDTRE